MIIKEQLITALKKLMETPGDSVLKEDARRVLSPILKNTHKEDPSPSAVNQLDALLKKFKEKVN